MTDSTSTASTPAPVAATSAATPDRLPIPAPPAPGKPSRQRSRRRSGPAKNHWWIHLILIVFAVVMVLPFLWQLSLSFQTLEESQRLPRTLLPAQLQFQNYQDVFVALPTFNRMLLNTVLVAVTKTVGVLIVATLAGYAFARLRFPGRGLLFGLFLSLMMIPGALFLLPQYEIVNRLGLLNSITGVVLPQLVNIFGIFMMRQFFMQLPNELEQAAKIDGASTPQIFFRVMLPLAKPAVVTLGVLSLLWSWNDLLWPLIVNDDPSKMVVAVGLASLKGQYTVNNLVLMAAATLATLPVLLMFIAAQKTVMNGIAFNGSVKG